MLILKEDLESSPSVWTGALQTECQKLAEPSLVLLHETILGLYELYVRRQLLKYNINITAREGNKRQRVRGI